MAATAKKALRGLGINAKVEPVPVGSHQSNGDAERSVHLIRQLGDTFMQQIEINGGAPKQVFPVFML